jgi:hypothetical protein
MLTGPVHHIYDKHNQVIAHNLTTEEMEQKINEIEEYVEILTLEPPNYREASY